MSRFIKLLCNIIFKSNQKIISYKKTNHAPFIHYFYFRKYVCVVCFINIEKLILNCITYLNYLFILLRLKCRCKSIFLLIRCLAFCNIMNYFVQISNIVHPNIIFLGSKIMHLNISKCLESRQIVSKY